jgi:eukaryotic-like serine/threonine-protein kinase
MGEVYRARDTKLGRDVAIKILPQAFLADPERVARFDREARTLASLNHPNIGGIYGLEEANGSTALVMELVEGEDLAQRIARGAIPLEEALPIAKQIAEALEAAHEKGIVHRDLKPANIKLRPDGTVKVLDFGLAKALQPGSATTSPVVVTNSPTLTSPVGVTGIGIILGTAAYMSPEQARGRTVDKRSDIWAFGCVLYEMLTAKRAFDGEDVGGVLADIIKDEPNLDRVPPRLQPLIQNCLEKDPRKRLRDIGDIGLLLNASGAARPRRTLWLWPAVSALLLAAVVGLSFLYVRRAPPAREPLRFEVSTPGNTPAQMFALSPDGRHLTFITGNPLQLWVRPMDALESRVLPDTEGASFPFWSPDGQRLGFFAQGKLKTIWLAGGPPQSLCDAISGRGGSWSRDGTILFSASNVSPILRIASTGGSPVPVTMLPAGVNEGHRYPSFLPDGRHFLFNVGTTRADAAGVYVGSLDGGEPVRLLPDFTNALYAARPGGRGLLVFLRDRTLTAQRFDPNALKTEGDMFPLAEGVDFGNAVLNTFGAFTVSGNGTLAYQIGGTALRRELVWVDRSGKRLDIATKPAQIQNPYSVSPDEKMLAMRIAPGLRSSGELWLQDLTRGVISRLTSRGALDGSPIWSPDATRIVFNRPAAGGYSYDLFQKLANGSENEESLLHTGAAVFATDWSTDGRFIAYIENGGQTSLDLWILPLTGERKPIVYLRTAFNEQDGQFLPDAGDGPRWMAYQSNESGRDQIHIQAVPASGAKYQISTEGGTVPRWRRDGRELFYISSDQRLIAVPISVSKGLQVGKPQPLFANAGMNSFVPSKSGDRFLTNVPASGEQAVTPPIIVVTDWTATIAR